MRKSAVVAVANESTDKTRRRQAFSRATYEAIEHEELIPIHDFDCLIEFGTLDDWSYASSNIVLPESIIRHAANKVNWSGICKYQDVSHELLLEFSGRINIHALYFSKFIKYETIRYFFHQLQVAQNGTIRRPTRTIKRVIKENNILRLLRLKKFPGNALHIIKKYIATQK